MNAWDQTKRQLLEEIRILRSRNAKLERINHEMPGGKEYRFRNTGDCVLRMLCLIPAMAV